MNIIIDPILEEQDALKRYRESEDYVGLFDFEGAEDVGESTKDKSQSKEPTPVELMEELMFGDVAPARTGGGES